MQQAALNTGGHLALQAVLPGQRVVKDPRMLDANTGKPTEIPVSEKMYQATYNPQTLSPSEAARYAYRHPFQTSVSGAYRAGEELLRPWLNKTMSGYHNVMNRGPVVGGLSGAGAGALLGLLGKGALNWFRGDELTSGMGRGALLGALLGAVGGGYSGYHHAQPDPSFYKSGSMFQEGSGISRQEGQQLQTLINMIGSAPGLSFNQRAELMSGVRRLPGNDINQLLQTLLSSGGGAAIGVLVAKFLMRRGLVGQVLGALMGGMLGRAVFGPTDPKNYLGQKTLNGRDFSGNLL